MTAIPRPRSAQALLDAAGGSQRDRILAAQELRRSSAASPHTVRRPGEGRGTRRQQRLAAARASLNA